MSTLFRCPEHFFDNLQKHLLGKNDGREHAAFVFATPNQTDDEVIFDFIDWLPLGEGDYAVHGADYLELFDETRARILKKAFDLNASLVEFHCHPSPVPAQFSESDRAGLKEFVPHVWWRLKHRPYAAVVVGPSDFDGLAWLNDPKTPVQLDGILVGDTLHRPTRHTLPTWRAQSNRFDRNIRLFGVEGQKKICRASVAVVGCGGLGTHVIQQLAYLGIGSGAFIDDEVVDETNPNRYVGLLHTDPVPGMPKVELAEKIAQLIDPAISTRKIFDSLTTPAAFDAIKNADYVFGCLDDDGARLILNELCQAYSLQYFDLASDVLPGPPLAFGGRVCVSWDGDGCPVCLGALDLMSAQRDMETPEDRANREAIYGVNRKLLGETGPSVVSINGVVASLAVTEFMVAVTGIRRPQRLMNYYGHQSSTRPSTDQPNQDCYYCKGIRGRRKEANVERYLKIKGRKKRSA